MTMWKFYDFLDGRGVNLIRQWLDGLPTKAQAKIDTRLLFMQAIAVWPEPWVSALKGWPELIELRIGAAGNAYRPLGFYGPERREFTITLGAIEKGKLPRRVLEVADANRKIVIATARNRICEHQFDKTADAQQSADGH
jgi:hypothetical protein